MTNPPPDKNNAWNLTPLYKSDTDPKILEIRKIIVKKTEVFIKKWKKRTDYLKSGKVLKKALDEYNDWQENYGALHIETYYWHLRYSQNQVDPKIRAAMTLADDISKKLENSIRFFELNLAKIPEAKQKSIIGDKNLKEYKHFLERIFAYSPHMLSESEEKIINLKSTSSYENWVRMVSGFLSKEEAKVLDEDGKVKKSVPFSELSGLMNCQNKEVRDTAAKEFNRILEKYSDVSEAEFNSILQDKKVNDELRHYSKPYSARLLGDDIEEEVVENLIDAVSEKFGIPQKFYKLKAKLLGVKHLAYHERNVEYGKVDKNYSFSGGVALINKTFTGLDTEFGLLLTRFIREKRVDVYPGAGKSGGAFCTYGLITNPVYILLNWNNKLNDVLTFAHELGHGINDELVKKSQNALNFGTPVSTAEVASTFMEDFVLEELIKNADDELKLSLMMMKLNEDVSTIFRQIACFKLEEELHQKFRKVGYLSKEIIGEIFNKNMFAYMGSGVEKSKGCENWWVYWSHLRYFFYVYSYASGLLISKSLQAEVRRDPKFINKVKIFLSTGLSESPKNIFTKLGINITDKDFWYKGLDEVENLLNETESLAKALGKF